MSRILTLALLMALGAVSAQAQEFKAGDITVDKAWARATPKGAEVGAGYLTIHNNGATADRITGGSADFAGVQVHEMKTEGGVMKMREVSGGLEIPAHGSVTLAPNGYHIMFVGLKKPLVKGETAKATLTFEHAGALVVDFPIGGIGASGAGAAKKDDMNGMKM